MIKFYNKYHLYISIFLLVAIVLLIYLYYSKKCICQNISVIETNREKIKETSVYYVDIKGEVINPGVYEIEDDKRLVDVINIAGGLTENADVSLLNLSKKIVDEMNITIYSKDKVKNAIDNLKEEPTIIEVIKEIEKECVCPTINDACINDYEEEEKSNVNIDNNDLNKKSIVNINTGSLEELMTIPKIGESKAKSIIEYRNTTKFNTIEDIKNVSGIGDKLFDSIKENITV